MSVAEYLHVPLALALAQHRHLPPSSRVFRALIASPRDLRSFPLRRLLPSILCRRLYYKRVRLNSRLTYVYIVMPREVSLPTPLTHSQVPFGIAHHKRMYHTPIPRPSNVYHVRRSSTDLRGMYYGPPEMMMASPPMGPHHSAQPQPTPVLAYPDGYPGRVLHRNRVPTRNRCCCDPYCCDRCCQEWCDNCCDAFCYRCCCNRGCCY